MSQRVVMASVPKTWTGRGAMFVRFGSCSSGATAIEYGLITAILAIALITTFRLFGTSLQSMYVTIGTIVTNFE